jgi:hypothetical protein
LGGIGLLKVSLFEVRLSRGLPSPVTRKESHLSIIQNLA